jgi:Uma2 family endonuclease
MEESMSMTSTLSSPGSVPPAVVPTLYRLSVDQYEAMADADILTERDQVELLNGFLVIRMTKKPAHSVAARAVAEALAGMIPDGYFVTREDPIRIGAASEPEPDAAVVCGRSRDYARRHPDASQVALVVEVADSSLSLDRTEKLRIYATGEIPVYWIVNLVDGRLEVYSQPDAGTYLCVRSLGLTEAITVEVDGRGLGAIAVADLLP